MARPPLALRVARKLGVLPRTNLGWSATVGGRRYRVPVVGGTGWQNARGGGSDPWREPFLRAALKAPGPFVDVGANVGQTVLHLLALDPDRAVIACEPNATCVDYLHRLAAANDLSGLTVVPAGLSDRDGLLPIHDHGDHSAIASLVDGFRPAAFYTRTRQVAVLRGDAALEALGVGPANPVAAVKVDVEGGELEVLRGLRGTLERDRPPVFCELLPVIEPGHDTDELRAFRQGRQDELLGLIRGLGYRLFRTPHDGGAVPLDAIEPHADLALCDYLFLPADRADAFFRAAGVTPASPA